MGTLVCFHAHPDDEALTTGGTMARATAQGHRVVLVTATRGEHGEVPDGYLGPDEPLWQRREQELSEACAILGVARQQFLGYVDSGMMGTAENAAPDSFWQADVEEAAVRLAQILESEKADVLTVYDDHGNYGHPDHIQVHRVGIRAAELAGTTRVYEATVNRDHVRHLMEEAEASEDVAITNGDRQALAEQREQTQTMGTPAEQINTEVDITPWISLKRQALAAHGSQVGDSSFFLSMPLDAFTAAFGHEWFIRRDVPDGWQGTDLLEGVA
jgi:LmbE family N-acetylglucosaminyl deacetylase